MATRSYTPVARAEAEERTRSALLDAATRIFFEEDWASTPLAQIAAEAGVTKQTLLRHYGSRDGLARAAFERARDAAASQRMAVPSGDISAAVETLLDHYDEFGDRALKLEALAPGAPGYEFLLEGRRFHYDWVRAMFGPLLEPLPRSERERRLAALIAICDVHTWRLLSSHLGMPRAEVSATLLMSVQGVLKR